MIAVMDLAATIKKGLKTGQLYNSDTLEPSPRTGNLVIQRKGRYIGHIEMNTGQIIDWNLGVDAKVIKGLHANFIVLDEISAFLEVKAPGHTDEDGKDVLYQHMAANDEAIREAAGAPFTVPEQPMDVTMIEAKTDPQAFSTGLGRTRHDNCVWINSERRYDCEPQHG